MMNRPLIWTLEGQLCGTLYPSRGYMSLENAHFLIRLAWHGMAWLGAVVWFVGG